MSKTTKKASDKMEMTEKGFLFYISRKGNDQKVERRQNCDTLKFLM